MPTDHLEYYIQFNAYYCLHQELARPGGEISDPQLAAELLAILQRVCDPCTHLIELAQARDAVSRSPAARKRMAALLAGSRAEERLVEPAGDMLPPAPGRLLRCPQPGCPLRQYELAKGEEYRCPTHHVLLQADPPPQRGRRR